MATASNQTVDNDRSRYDGWKSGAAASHAVTNAGTVPKLTVKNIRTSRGHDGDAWSAVIYIDGKRAGEVVDDSWGGGLQMHWFTTDNEQIGAWRKDLDQAGIEWALGEASDHWTPDQITHVLAHRYDAEMPKTMNKWGCFANPVEGIWEIAVAGLVDKALEERQIKNLCRNSIPFRNPSDKSGTWRVIKSTWAKVEALGWARQGKGMEEWGIGCPLADIEFAHVTYKGMPHPFR